MITVKLKLPKTIRMLEVDTYEGEKYKEIAERAANNNIVEGYTLNERENTPPNPPFKFYAEVNIDNNKLWGLFKSLMMNMNEQQSFITSLKDDEIEDAEYSEYQDKYTLYNKLEKYQERLTIDGFLQFGTMYQTETYFEEVFVHNAKYIQFWEMNENKFRELMHNYSLYEVKDLEFIDNYPRVATALDHLEKELPTAEDFIKELRRKI